MYVLPLTNIRQKILQLMVKELHCDIWKPQYKLLKKKRFDLWVPKMTGYSKLRGTSFLNHDSCPKPRYPPLQKKKKSYKENSLKLHFICSVVANNQWTILGNQAEGLHDVGPVLGRGKVKEFGANERERHFEYFVPVHVSDTSLARQRRNIVGTWKVNVLLL